MSFLKEQNRKLIETETIERHAINVLGIETYWKTGGYTVFAAVLRGLVDEEILLPVVAKGTNSKNPALHYWYRIVSSDEKPDRARTHTLLTFFHPAINTSYYLNHSREFQEDEKYLSALDHFLKENNDLKNMVSITANERSFQICRDEKWLLSAQGKKFLQRVKLTLEDLRCYVTHEPFFYYARRQQNEGFEVNVLIVENKDTFFSLKTLFQEGINSWDGIPFSLLVYGEGRKIEKSITFFDEIDNYRNSIANFYYFGDLDPEGISIWHAIAGILSVQPFVLFYNSLFDRYGVDAPVLGKSQRFSQDAVKAFLTHFSADAAVGIQKMLLDGRYLPQEGLDYAFLRELATESRT